MSQDAELIEHHDCPETVKLRLILAGGMNRFGKPNFRLVWGYDRIIKMHGEWQEVEPATATGLFTPEGKTIMTKPRIKSSVIETREVPKYLPGNCWHLEKWCPPEMYGTPESWAKAGEEVVGAYTIDTAGPFPSQGEYELVMPLTIDGTPRGQRLPLYAGVVEEIIHLIQRSVDFRFAQRRAAIMQRMEREDKQFTDRAEDILRDGLPALSGREFVTRGEANG
jgi:hypothetical protein